MANGVCGKCGVIGELREVIGQAGPHYGKLECSGCGGFNGWIPKPENESKRSKNKYTPERLGIDTCQMCQRHELDLGMYEVLEVHHVVEIQHGGGDTPDNIWCVCTPCHKYIHHTRIYLNDHQKHKMTKETLMLLMEKDRVPEDIQGMMLKILEGGRR